MNQREVQAAVFEAFRLDQYDQCFSLLDAFLETAAGADLAWALSLRAELILMCDKKRAAEGLLLIDEALEYLDQCPGEAMAAVIIALGLCWAMGDVEKARKYEAQGHRLLQHHPDNILVRSKRFRLHLNLGLIAQLRGELAAAYWHFMQAVSCLQEWGSDNGSDLKCWLFRMYERMIEVCLRMNRFPEAEDYLEKARQNITEPPEDSRWTLQYANFLRCTRRNGEALAALEGLAPFNSDCWTPALIAQYHLLRAMIAHDDGDVRTFHRHLSLAQRKAVEHSLDFMVCEIQRVQRSPIYQGVAR